MIVKKLVGFVSPSGVLGEKQQLIQNILFSGVPNETGGKKLHIDEVIHPRPRLTSKKIIHVIFANTY